jgi:anti-sigma factor (TIGR02949 family)
MTQPLHSTSPQDHGSNGRSHTCEETLRKVLLLLDHEMPEPDQQLLMIDIQSCEDCLKKYNIEREFKAFMHAKFVKKSCTDHLRTQIQDIVRTQIN